MTKLSDQSGSADIAEFMDECQRLESCRALAARMAEIPPEPLPAPRMAPGWWIVPSVVVSWVGIAAFVWALLT